LDCATHTPSCRLSTWLKGDGQYSIIIKRNIKGPNACILYSYNNVASGLLSLLYLTPFLCISQYGRYTCTSYLLIINIDINNLFCGKYIYIYINTTYHSATNASQIISYCQRIVWSSNTWNVKHTLHSNVTFICRHVAHVACVYNMDLRIHTYI